MKYYKMEIVVTAMIIIAGIALPIAIMVYRIL